MATFIFKKFLIHFVVGSRQGFSCSSSKYDIGKVATRPRSGAWRWSCVGGRVVCVAAAMWIMTLCGISLAQTVEVGQEKSVPGSARLAFPDNVAPSSLPELWEAKGDSAAPDSRDSTHSEKGNDQGVWLGFPPGNTTEHDGVLQDHEGTLSIDLVDSGVLCPICRPAEVTFVEFEKGLPNANDPGGPRGSCYRSQSTNYSIPDNICEWDVYSPITISCASSGKTITGMDLHLEITHTYVGDLEVLLCNEASDLCVWLWQREGGSADDIDETWYGISNFNGEQVNQTWRVWARDCAGGDVGYIDYWWIELYYDDDPAELVINDWDCENEPWTWGQTAQIDLDIENIGGELADTYVKVIASNDTTLWDDDDHTIFDWHVQISAGAHWTKSNYTWTLPSTPYPAMPENGTVYYYVHVGTPFDLSSYDSVSMSMPFSPPNLVASSCSVVPSSAIPGERLTFYYRIYNPNSYSVSVGLGASIKPTGTWNWRDDPAHDIYVTCPAGYSNQSRYFDVPAGEQVFGSYDAGWGLYEQFDGTQWDLLVKDNQVEIESPCPTITSFFINNGASTTSTRTVTLNNSCTRSPMHYMASEDSGFSGASWQSYSAVPSFLLSDGAGLKTVWFKVKNQYCESEVGAMDTIEYIPPVGDVSGTIQSARWPYFPVPGMSVTADTGEEDTSGTEGNYLLPDVPFGSRSITADGSLDWWATGTSFTETKNITVNGNETVNFTGFRCKGQAEVSIVVDDDTVSPSDTFNVTVTVKNTSYALGDVLSYLDLSFDDSKVTVGTPSGSGWTGGIQPHPPGSTIYGVNSAGDPITITPSQDYLVSGVRDGSFNWNDEYSFTVPLTVKPFATPGTITLNYRGTIGDERDPDSTGSGTRDEQGFNVYTTDVLVEEPCDAPSISGLSRGDGPAGMLLGILGTDFGSVQGSDHVTFGGTAATAYESWSDTQIWVYVPSGASDGNVVVHTDCGSSNGMYFDVNSGPSAQVLNHDVPTTASVNEPFYVYVRLRNSSSYTGDSGGITISFPDLTATDPSMPPYNSAKADVEVHGDTTFSSSEILWADNGDELADCGGSPCTAQHLLVEGDEEFWSSNETQVLKLRVTPKQAGTLKVRMRGWICVGGPNGYGPPISRDPPSGGSGKEQDQQFYWSYVTTVDVTQDVAIENTGLSPLSVRDGETLELSYQIYSPTQLDAWLGATLHEPSGDSLEDGDNDTDVTLVEGTSWYSRDFHINLAPSYPTGQYDVAWGVHWLPDGETYSSIDDVLSVLPTIPVPVPILMYHKIGPESASEYWVTTEMFEAEMRALKAYGYTAITLQDLMDYRAGISSPPGKPVLITFDDGYENLLTEAFPVLSDAAIDYKATAFIITDKVGGDNAWDTAVHQPPYDEPVINHLTWSQIQTLHASSLIDVQSHSDTHPHFTALTVVAQITELETAKAEIETHLGKTVRFLCWPYGEHNLETEMSAWQTGHFAATAVGSQVEQDSVDKWELKRVSIDHATSVDYNPADPDHFFMTRIGDEDVEVPQIAITGLTVRDATTGEPVTTVRPGDTVRISVTGTSSGPATPVIVSLNIDDDDDPGNGLIYDTHQVDPLQDLELTLPVGPLDLGEWLLWTVPMDAPQGQYYAAVGFHDQYYVLGYAYYGWEALFHVLPPSPAPEITEISVSGQTGDSFIVPYGEPVDISITGVNHGGTSLSGLIQVSFLELDEPSDHILVGQSQPWDPDLMFDRFYPGGPDPIWHRCGTEPNPKPAEYLLVQAEDGEWLNGESNTATFALNAPELGEYHLLVKLAMWDNDEDWLLDPAGGEDQDQQCEHVYVKRVCIGVAPPVLQVRVGQPTSAAFEQGWVTKTIGGDVYDWRVWTVEHEDDMPVGDGPLSNYAGTIVAIIANDESGQARTDLEDVRSALIVTENALSLARSTFSGVEETIEPGFIGEQGIRTDDHGNLYRLHRSLVSDSAGSLGEFLECNTTSGLGDYNTRVEIWKNLAMRVALQAAIYTRLDAGDQGAEFHRTSLHGYANSVCKSAGAMSEANRIMDVLNRFNKMAPDGWVDIDEEFVHEVGLIVDDMDNILTWEHLEYTVVIRRRLNHFKQAFTGLKNAMAGVGGLLTISGSVAEAMMLQAVAQAQGEERIAVLRDLADSGVFIDPAATAGITQAQEEYEDIKDSFFDAWVYLRQEGTTLETIDDLVSLVQAGMQAGSIFQHVGGGMAQKIASRLPHLSGHATKVFGTMLGAGASAFSIVLSIDSTLRVLREGDLALTMEWELKQFLRNNNDLGQTPEPDEVARLLHTDQMRYYLQYYHFERCLNIINAEWYDFYRIILLDPIGGLMWWYRITDDGTLEEAVRLYSAERLEGIENAMVRLDERGRVSPLLWDTLGALVVPSYAGDGFEEISMLDLTGGVDRWFRCEVRNHGSHADIAYLSVSIPEGLEVSDTEIQSLSGAWQEYPIGGDPIWHHDDTDQPTLTPIHTLYEWSGLLPSGGPYYLSLRLRAADDGVYWLRTRVAALPACGNGSSQSAFVHWPTDGPLDQQGWESYEIDVVRGVEPTPWLDFSPDTQLSVVVGYPSDLVVNYSNNGGPALEAYLDASHENGVQIEAATPATNWEDYRPGEPIWNSSGQEFPAIHTLWSRFSPLMRAGASESYCIRLRAIEPGQHQVFIRGSLRGPGMQPQEFARYPVSGPVDQQGWHAIPITVSAVTNQAPIIDSFDPPDTVLLRERSGEFNLSVGAHDPDSLPEALTYYWSLDGEIELGEAPTIAIALADIDLGEHTIVFAVSDGLANARHEWQLNLVDSLSLSIELEADREWQYENTPEDDTAHIVTFTANVTDSEGNSDFTYIWHAPVHPETGRTLGLIVGGGPSDATATYATPVLPPQSEEPYYVHCTVTGLQNGASDTSPEGVVVIPLPPLFITHIHQDSGAVREGIINPDGPCSIQAQTKGLTVCTIQFSEDVNILPSDVEIRDADDTMDETWPSTFDYEPATYTLTMTWPDGTFEDQWVRIHVLNSVTSMNTGAALDGEIYAISGDPGSGLDLCGELPSGDGISGGSAMFVLGSLISDVTGNRIVNVTDRGIVLQNIGKVCPEGDLPSDITGNCVINVTDCGWVQQRIGNTLPALPTP